MHTPGPWTYREGTDPHCQGQVSSEQTGATVAITYQDDGGDNARLIAAAPDLLAACILALRNGNVLIPEQISAIEQAIAKAEGK